ncbi:MAG: hypothetical protein R2706_09740 [Acidimicrobiales bacterium]
MAPFAVTFVPVSAASIDNQAVAMGTGRVSGGNTTALSSVGSDHVILSDPVGPTPTGPMPLAPASRSAKSLESLVDNGDGTFTTNYVISVTNTGNEASPLDSRSPTTWRRTTCLATRSAAWRRCRWPSMPASTVDSIRICWSGTTPLAVGETGKIRYAVTFTPVSVDPIDNLGIASAPVERVANRPSRLRRSRPIRPTQPTPVGPTSTGPFCWHHRLVRRSRSMAPLSANGDGTFSVTFRFTIENPGNEPVTNVQLNDELSAFGDDVVVNSVTSSDFVVNPAYNAGPMMHFWSARTVWPLVKAALSA